MTNKIKDILKTHKYLLLSFFLPVLLLEGIAIAEKIQPFGSESFLIVDALVFKDMSSFAGWSMFGCLAGAGQTQGLNIL